MMMGRAGMAEPERAEESRATSHSMIIIAVKMVI